MARVDTRQKGARRLLRRTDPIRLVPANCRIVWNFSRITVFEADVARYKEDLQFFSSLHEDRASGRDGDGGLQRV